MKTQKIEAPNGAIAVHESGGQGPPVVLILGNSSSSRAFSRQLEGPLGGRVRLVAIDLPGHGESDDARDPSAYSLPGHARAVRAVVEALDLHEARFVGWSLGGHVTLEMAPDLPRARGFVIFGTPPVPSRTAQPVSSHEPAREPFLPNPTMRFTFQENIDKSEASAYVAAFFKPSFADVPAFYLQDALRTDGRARSGLGSSVEGGLYRDEVEIVRDLEVPLAVLHGGDEQLVNGQYFGSVAMPSLWRGAVQMIPYAGHAPHWETPKAFDALLEAFVEETA
ncbi:MAG: alpha/beta hydrolase [Hyphomicrobiales bacterium]|nr:alpha/beta hydrolase [Hyphomicrobiales bacterium]